MRKPRILPVVITVVISAAALFGGWTLYKQVAVASPLANAVQDLPGVLHAGKPEVSQEEVRVSVELSGDANLKDVYASINEESAEVSSGRKLSLDIQTKEDPALEGIWQSALFEIAEAMENKTYSDIPKTMERVTAAHEGVEAVTEMDETNVYITIRSEKGAKYIVLPRTPNTLGVWPNA
ncbi:hypothetical protein D3P08_08805 [Paenibacillus nanensis]|uniref:Uncharacterized protein n=1 Tax=Paenibacillus nanensis TaxID=393251 RepID=A0A3A1V7X4_9BACL|nr:hypothetical protein [Paenibacillus nanensis]RIX53530.1 hypothetical protein D3P08_08805 [Paenibacillus nanensis]